MTFVLHFGVTVVFVDLYPVRNLRFALIFRVTVCCVPGLRVSHTHGFEPEQNCARSALDGKLYFCCCFSPVVDCDCMFIIRSLFMFVVLCVYREKRFV